MYSVRKTNCPTCGAEVEWPAKDCTECGGQIKKFRNMEECRVCGELVAKSANKCPHCGARNPSKTNLVVMSAVGLIVGITFVLVWNVIRNAIF